MRKLLRVLSAVSVVTALWLGAPAQSQADPLVIQLPEGQFQISGFDPGPGNLLITGIPTSGLAMGTVLETYFQANMSAILGTNNLPIGGIGLNSTYELAVVARFTEVVTSVAPSGPGSIATFGLNPVQANPFFEVWFHNGILADNFAGTGFATGTKILSGRIGAITTSLFQTNSFDPAAAVLIDNPTTGGGTAAGKAFWNIGPPATTTVQGAGNNNLNLATMVVDSVVLNPVFFPKGQTILSYALRPGTGLEYTNVDPSKQLDALPNGGGFITSTELQGKFNGSTGSAATGKLLIEIDDKESFTASAAVPEPSTMVLSMTGLGVLGLFRTIRRRRQARA
jgi:hypothetical protein